MPSVVNQNPALVIFAFNRPEHLRKTLLQLSKAEDVSSFDIHVFIDGPRNAEDASNILRVQNLVSGIDFGQSLSIISSSKNLGLANSVISGITKVFNNYSSVIVLEDDLIVHPLFLRYMKEALIKYADSRNVFSISGYNYPLRYKDSDPDYYLSHRSSSWGWGTWKKNWNLVDWACSSFNNLELNPDLIKSFNRGGDDLFELLRMQMDGKIDSWSIRFDYAHFEHESYCLHPKKSLVENIGFDGTGTHPSSIKSFKQTLSIFELSDYPSIPVNLEFNELMQRRFDAYFRPRFPSLRHLKRIISKRIRVR